jgi:type III secretion system FlhB-like substrate exporter
MSFASITLGGTITAASREDKRVTARFQPDTEHAPELTITGYGEVADKLEQLAGSPAVVTGQVKHVTANNIFTIDCSDAWVSAPFGKPQAIISLVGRYSTRYAEENKGAYQFQVSYPSGLKKDDGGKAYFNWRVSAFGKTSENIRRFMNDGEPIAIPTGILQWYAKGDKLYLSVLARAFSFVGGRTND